MPCSAQTVPATAGNSPLHPKVAHSEPASSEPKQKDAPALNTSASGHASDEDLDDTWYRDKKLRSVKRSSRSELSVSKGEWRRHGYARSNLLSTAGVVDSVPRVSHKDLTAEQFSSRYEVPRLPVVITGLTDSWAAQKAWEPEALAAVFGKHKFKVGSDDDGYAVRLHLRWFLDYVTHPEHSDDDSPLYIFDGTFADRSGSRAMGKHYEVPDFFREDLFRLVGERRRPPYRWFVMGPARSGSGLHIDPLATSAWNTLLSGHKRWVLFPPGTPRALVLPKEAGLEKEAATWFTKVYPRTQSPDWPTAAPVEIIQGPGETVFVPGGWWHAVLNLDLTVAVTQNFVSSSNFERVWKHASKGRPKMSAKLLQALKSSHPHLAAQAVGMQDRQETGCNASSSSSSSSDSSSSSSSSSSEEDSPEGDRKRKQHPKHDNEDLHGMSIGQQELENVKQQCQDHADVHHAVQQHESGK